MLVILALSMLRTVEIFRTAVRGPVETTDQNLFRSQCYLFIAEPYHVNRFR